VVSRPSAPATAPAPETAPDPVHISGAELLRRLLLGAITALVVARPLVLGEDPGLLGKHVSNPAGLLLTLLWFVVAVMWAGWRLWTRQRSWYGSAVEGALLALVALVFLSAARAGYHHPAYLIAWEWAALLVAFCLVRQLARTERDNQRLLAVVVATGVCISAAAIYHYSVSLPGQRDSIRPGADRTHVATLPDGQEYDRHKLAEQLKSGGIYILDEAELDTWAERMFMNHAFGCFAHPNALAGYLALLLPVGIGWTLSTWKQRLARWKTVAAALCALTMGLALWFTHSKGAILSLVVVGVVMATLQAYRLGFVGRKGLLLGAGAAALLLVVLLVGKESGLGQRVASAFGQRREYWNTTWQMIFDKAHPKFVWLGVGPGNFGRHYVQYLSPQAVEEITDPHNFALEVWATSGIFALAALLAAFALFFRYTWPTLLGKQAETTETEPQEPDAPADGSRTHWEFYLGGMAGLTLAFFLWALSLGGEGAAENVREGAYMAGGRSLVWFIAFGLLENIAIPAAVRVTSLSAGVGALLLNLTVSGGIAIPTVAQPLWIAMALALNAVSPRLRVWNFGSNIMSVAPMPLTAAVALVYLLVAVHPALSAARAMAVAAMYRENYAKLLRQVDPAEEQTDKERALRSARNYLRQNILPPVVQALNADGGDIDTALELSNWNAELWRLEHDLGDPRATSAKDQALGLAQGASRLDPQNPQPYVQLYNLNMAFAGRADPATRQKFYGYAAQQMEAASERVPTRAIFHYRAAEAFMEAGNPADARRQAERARQLDQQAQRRQRKLNDQQRKKVEEWLSER
jgi:hypothetical protein